MASTPVASTNFKSDILLTSDVLGAVLNMGIQKYAHPQRNSAGEFGQSLAASMVSRQVSFSDQTVATGNQQYVVGPAAIAAISGMKGHSAMTVAKDAAAQFVSEIAADKLVAKMGDGTDRVWV